MSITYTLGDTNGEVRRLVQRHVADQARVITPPQTTTWVQVR